MNITRFMTHIDQMARQNRFEVEIFAPAIQLRMRGMRCQKATMPGKTFEVDGFKPIPAGWAKHSIKGVTYPQDITLGFILDSTFEDHQKIELWQQYMYNDDYSMRYPKGDTGYLGTVIIRQLDKGGSSIYEVTLEDAFPQAVTGLTLDMGASSIQTFDVTFNYRTWHSSYENSPAGSILGALFQKAGRKLKSKVRQKAEDRVFKEGRRSLSNRLGLGD